MMIKPKPWTQHFRRALSSPGNLIAAAGAVMASAITWNPLPLILYGLGEPVWLYTATTGRRYTRQLLDERKGASTVESRRSLEWREQQIAFLLQATPCGAWTRRGQLPDYAGTYVRLVEMRDQTARIVASRDDAAKALEEDIVAKLDDMLRGYLMMTKERMLFHCSLAKVYPQLPEPPAPQERPTLLARVQRALIAPEAPEPRPVIAWREETRFTSLEDALAEVRGKIAGFVREIQRNADHEDVYRPIIAVLERRLEELEHRGKNDLSMAAQLKVFPDQFEIILNKLATTQADVSEVVSDMKLLLEQTDDTVQFAEDTRSAERHTISRLTSMGQN